MGTRKPGKPRASRLFTGNSALLAVVRQLQQAVLADLEGEIVEGVLARQDVPAGQAARPE
jgi:hypothetical protein